MKEPNEDPILAELKKITKLLALSLISGESSLNEQIKLLNRYGFQPKDISELLQVNPNTVKSTIFRSRHVKKKG